MVKFLEKKINNLQKYSLIKRFFVFFLEPRSYNLETSLGYTLVEMLAVITIISLLMGVTLFNYSKHKDEDILILEAQKIAQLIRRSQNLALAPQLGGSATNGFGIYATTTVNNRLILFSDSDPSADPVGDNRYSSATEKIEELLLSPLVKISVLQAPPGDGTTPDEAYLNILYIPPDPTLTIFDNTSEIINTTDVLIAVSFVSDPTKRRIIKVNKAGLVEVQ